MRLANDLDRAPVRDFCEEGAIIAGVGVDGAWIVFGTCDGTVFNAGAATFDILGAAVTDEDPVAVPEPKEGAGFCASAAGRTSDEVNIQKR